MFLLQPTRRTYRNLLISRNEILEKIMGRKWSLPSGKNVKVLIIFKPTLFAIYLYLYLYVYTYIYLWEIKEITRYRWNSKNISITDISEDRNNGRILRATIWFSATNLTIWRSRHLNAFQRRNFVYKSPPIPRFRIISYDPHYAYFLYSLCKVSYIQISFGKNSSYGLE